MLIYSRWVEQLQAELAASKSTPALAPSSKSLPPTMIAESHPNLVSTTEISSPVRGTTYTEPETPSPTKQTPSKGVKSDLNPLSPTFSPAASSGFSKADSMLPTPSKVLLPESPEVSKLISGHGKMKSEDSDEVEYEDEEEEEDMQMDGSEDLGSSRESIEVPAGSASALPAGQAARSVAIVSFTLKSFALIP